MRWTGTLNESERRARDDELLKALEHASDGGRVWADADAIVRGLPEAHRRLAPHSRLSVQGAGQILSRMARAGTVRARPAFISSYKPKSRAR